MRYGGMDDEVEVTWNILDHNANQFLQHFVFIWENRNRVNFFKYFYIW